MEKEYNIMKMEIFYMKEISSMMSQKEKENYIMKMAVII